MIRFTLTDKGPAGDDVYSIDWIKHIGSDTVTGTPTSQVTEGTIVIHNEDNPDNHTTRFWVRGGIAGEVARARIFQPTSAGRILEGEIVIGVR